MSNRAFVNLKKNQELLDGKFKFGQDVTIRPNLATALDSLKDDEFTAEFEFLNYSEVIEAVNAAHLGDTWEYFHIKWVNSYFKSKY
jgi:hypothetical protein